MLDWTHVTITTNQQANDMLTHIAKIRPQIGAVDTETTGLHIILDKPFVVQWGYINAAKTKGWTYVVDLEKQPQLARACIDAWHEYAENLTHYLGANTKYDLHMLTNEGFSFPTHNLSDVQFYIRYAHDALAPRNGGVRLALTPYATRFIDPNAKYHDKKLQEERTSICSGFRNKLKARLKGIATLREVDDYFKDPVFAYDDLPEHIKTIYSEWLKEDVPPRLWDAAKRKLVSADIPYDMLDRDNLIKYAHMDIVYTIEVFLQCEPVLKKRNNEVAVDFENKVLIPLFEMERVGFIADVDYLRNAQQKMKQHILTKRERLWELSNGVEVKISQHKLLRKIIADYFNFELTSTNADTLNDTLIELKANREENAELIELIEIIQSLRSLEKWYSTYITRFLEQLNRGYDRLHTQISQVATVSGRVASDFQQFPREAIFDDDGNELFHPRRIVKAPEGGRLVYMDYSQVELRMTAVYTILIGQPDLNLCRAYLPYACAERDGKFYLEEDLEKEWEPTDLHGASATELFGVTPDAPDWKHWRSAAKTYNFMKNYGGGFAQSSRMFVGDSPDEIRRKDQAYYRVFPGIRAYHNYCYRLANEKAFAMNLFGVKYYGLSGHKIINILGQGSAAFLLKWKIYELWKFSKENNIPAKFQMNIHDECSWEDDGCQTTYEQFKQMQDLMQQYPESPVPIVAEMAVSYTNWGSKKDISTEEEFNADIST